MTSNVEIMAPAGSWESLRAAIKAGADSVYFGVGKLNMRARAAHNFQIEDLKEIVKICKENNIKSYLTVNIVYYDNELADMKQILNEAKSCGVTAVICSDMATIQYASSIGLEIHISTQANVSNIEAVKFYSKFADVIVLARELNIEQIKSIHESIIKENIKGPKGNLVEIELFAHGALCVSVSGKCYMSLAQYNHSANRGDCLQTCRRKYRVIDEETGDELVVDNKYVMSPKDLCTIGFVDKLIDSGVSVLKLEGRGRSPEYVYTVTKCYKEAVLAILDKTYSEEKIANWIKELETVFNRGFWHGGYYLGNKLGEWSGTYGSKATKKKSFIGQVVNYYDNINIVSLKLETGSIQDSDDIIIIGPTTGVIKMKITKMRNEDSVIEKASKGDTITFPVSEKVRKKDKVYVLKDTQ